MLGRYHYYRLHPFTMAEVVGRKSAPNVFFGIFLLLLQNLPLCSKKFSITQKGG